MAGGMAKNSYHEIGNDIVAEDMMDQIDKVSRQLLSSNAFEMTDGGIRQAVEEAARRVYSENGQELDPDGVAEIVNNFDYGPYTQQPGLSGEELRNSRLGINTQNTSDNPESPRRPLRRPNNN